MLGELFVYLWGSVILGLLFIIAFILNRILKALNRGRVPMDYFNDDEEE